MAVTEFIAAIELGSSKITGIAGRKHPDGSIQVLAVASSPSADCVRKGVIYNLDKTAQCLTSIVKRLESTLKASVGKVYVGVGGQSLRTVSNTESRHLDEETKITQEMVDSIMDSNREVPIVDQEILEVAPQEYKVGVNLLADPVGVPCSHIEGHFLNIIARNTVKQNIDRCFLQAGIEIADYPIAPLELAKAVLTSAEKRSGCMLVDFGAETTTVSVYKNNILRHLAVIPLGGNNITKDICSQQIEEEDAEELKKRYGDAFAQKGANDGLTYALEGKCNIEANVLEDIVEARVDEIIDNVWNQVTLSGYSDKLLAGAIFTGGGVNLRNIEKAFTERTKMEKIRVARESQLNMHSGVELKKDGTCCTLLALLAFGKDNCCRPPKPIEPLFPDTDEPMESEAERKRKEKEAAAKAARDAKEAEEERKRRKASCESLITKAKELKEEQKYKNALAQLKNARALDVQEYLPQIRELEKELNRLKKENSPMKRLTDFFGNLLEDEEEGKK